MKMTLSELFKAAHKLAKQIIKAGDNYHVTFGACLKFIKNESATAISKVEVKSPTDFIMNALLSVLEDYKEEMDGNNASDVLLPMSQFKEMLPLELNNKNTYRAIVVPVLKQLVSEGKIEVNKSKDYKGFFILKPVIL